MPFLSPYLIALKSPLSARLTCVLSLASAHVELYPSNTLRFPPSCAFFPATQIIAHRTALSAWLTGSTAPPDGQAGSSSRIQSACNEDGSAAVSVSWEDWQRAYEQARGAEGRQQQQGRVGSLGVGCSRGEQSKGRDDGSGRGEDWQCAYEQEHVKGMQGGRQETCGQGTEQCSGGRDGWGWVRGVAAQHGEGGGGEKQAQRGAVVQMGGKGRDVGDMQMQGHAQGQGQGQGQREGQGVAGGDGGWEWLPRPSAPPVWEMTGAVTSAVAQSVSHSAVALPEAHSAGRGYQEARAGAGVESGAEGWGRAGMGTGGGVGGVERMGAEGEGGNAVTGGGVLVAGVLPFQHTSPATPSAITPVSPAMPSMPLHTLTSARGLRQNRPLISVGPYQAYPADIRVVIKPSLPTAPSKAASKRPASTTASPAARLASTVARVARVVVGGGKVQVMPVAGTVQVTSGRVRLLGLAVARLHLAHHWPSSTSHLRLLLHSPFSAAHTCACRWSSTRLTRPHRHANSIRDREMQAGASRGAGSAGGGDMRASHVNTSNGLALDGRGNGRDGVCVSTDSRPGEGGLWSGGRGGVEQQGSGEAGSGGGGVVQVARAKACVPMWHGMDVRLTGSMCVKVPWVSVMVPWVSVIVPWVSGMVPWVSGMMPWVSGMVGRVSGALGEWCIG
ncbi:unnamed protein product [Closterium sp. Naga37s-1]|nr:unnamed protein product [Closterium sp. Naga37s-1]